MSDKDKLTAGHGRFNLRISETLPPGTIELRVDKQTARMINIGTDCCAQARKDGARKALEEVRVKIGRLPVHNRQSPANLKLQIEAIFRNEIQELKRLEE